MTTVTAEELLSAWEQGARLRATDRAPALLGVLDPYCRVDELSVGQCDALLFVLRSRVFGDLIDAVATCPACGESVELEFSVSSLAPGVGEPAAEVSAQAGGARVEARTMLNRDLRALARLGEHVTDRDIVAQCLLGAWGPSGEQVTVGELSDELITASMDALADADPAANVLLSITCPCGAAWTDQFDIRTFLWSEMDTWVTQVMHDVHHLASVYGWTESEILQLSPWRRDWYRQAVGW